jgi:hypothetical protein
MASLWLLLALAMPSAPVEPAAPAAAVPMASPAPIAAPAPETQITTLALACDAPQAAASPRFDVPANTLLELEAVDSVSSATNHPGDLFALRLSEPLRWGPTELLPAGTPVQGQVVHAARSRGGGKAGELLLAARYAQTAQGRIRLRSNFGASGKDHTKGALAASLVVGVFAMAIHGSEQVVTPGTPLSARLAEPVTFQCGAVTASPVIPPTPTATQGIQTQ